MSPMFIKNNNIEFKKTFKNVNYYSLPKSILFVVKKRLNFVNLIIINLLLILLFL
jgi:hypothetical protein